MANCCNKCGTQGKCGCNDSVLHLPPSCPAPSCPNPEPCAETFSDCCVIHNGDSYTFIEGDEPTFTVTQGERLCDVMQRFITYYFCSTSVLPLISGLKSNTINSTSINVSWNPVAGASYYEVNVSPVSAVAFTVAGTVTANTTPNFTITGLTPNTSYYVNITPFDITQKDGCPSVSIIVTTKPL